MVGMNVSITLFDPATGVRKTIEENHSETSDREGTEFYWTEGNNGCDCNRRILMKLVPNASFEPNPCGNTIKLESLKFDGAEMVRGT